MTAMSRNKGAAGERELFRILSYELGVAVRRKLGAARDGGCDGMDVPGWAVEVKRTEVLTLPPFWRRRSGRLSSLAPAGFVLAQEPGEVGGFMDPHDLAPEIFSLVAIRCRCRCRDGANWRGLGLRTEITGLESQPEQVRLIKCTLFRDPDADNTIS